MICKYCGKEMVDNSRFCPGCGRAVDIQEQSSKRQNKILPIAIVVSLAVIGVGAGMTTTWIRSQHMAAEKIETAAMEGTAEQEGTAAEDVIEHKNQRILEQKSQEAFPADNITSTTEAAEESFEESSPGIFSENYYSDIARDTADDPSAEEPVPVLDKDHQKEAAFMEEVRAVAEDDPAAIICSNGYTFNLLTGTYSDFISFLYDAGLTPSDYPKFEYAQPLYEKPLVIDTAYGGISLSYYTPYQEETLLDDCRLSKFVPYIKEGVDFDVFGGCLSYLQQPDPHGASNPETRGYFDNHKEEVISCMEGLGYECNETSDDLVFTKDFGGLATITVSGVTGYIANMDHLQLVRPWPTFKIKWNRHNY
jgi:hypothetical protein